MKEIVTISLIIFSHSISIFGQKTTELEKAVTKMEQVYKNTYNAKLGIETCKEVLKLVPTNSEYYFEASFYLGEWYIINRDKKEIQDLILQMKNDLDKPENIKFKKYWIYWTYLKSRQNYLIIYNYEKALVFGMYAFYEAKAYPKILVNVTPHIATLLGEVAQYSMAEGFIKTYKLTEGLSERNKFEKCKLYLNIGLGLYAAENYEEANKILQKAIAFIEPVKEEVPYLYDACLLAIGKNYVELLEPPELLIALRKTVEGRLGNYQFAGLLGMRLSSEDYYEEALPLLQQALVGLVSEFYSMNIEDNPAYGAAYIDEYLAGQVYYYKSWALRLKGLEYIENGNKEKGIQLLRKAIESGLRGVDLSNQMIDEMEGFEIASMMSNEMINVIQGGMIHAAKSLYHVTQTKEDLKQLFKFTEERRSLSIFQVLEESPIHPSLRPSFNAYKDEIRDVELQFMLGLDVSVDLFKDAVGTILEYEILFEKFKQTVKNVRLTTNDIDYINPVELQATLDNETVFIQYVVVRRHIYGILITDDVVQVELLLDGDYMIEKDVFPYIDAIRNPLLVQDRKRLEFIEQSNYFYNILIKPFEENMKGKTRFVVSPERELMFLPFETLLKTTENKAFNELDFLIKSFEINYRYSATLHQKIQERPAIRDYSFVGFAPVFKDGKGTGKRDRSTKKFRDSRYGSMEKKRFSYLPSSKREIEVISNLLANKGRIKTFLGEKATKQNLITSTTNQANQFIHIATHSMVNYDDPRLSSIACYHLENKQNLYFSTEISNLPIQADLVILSSCESGIGRIITGEGIIGLNRSFIIAGTRNVLFSLWKVNDKYSSELMISFYKNYLNNQDYTSALHQAKLQMLSNPKLANPRYWAPFILIGE